MNCEEIKLRVSIRTVLESFNLFPVKENRKTAFYFALDREEKIPSLSVDFVKNKAFDFGTGKSYDVISIVQQKKRCSVSEALRYLDNFVFPAQVNSEIEETVQRKTYKILKVGKIEHPALIQYLKFRKVYEQNDLVKEIEYEVNGKKYFGVGFYNDSGGIEIRNKYSKICLGKKDITTVRSDLNSCNEILVFEGFFDYLTYKNLEGRDNSNADYLILNSTAMLFRIKKELHKFDKISLFLDNDFNGISTKEIIKKKYGNVDDCSLLYVGFKDLNEYFCNSNRL